MRLDRLRCLWVRQLRCLLSICPGWVFLWNLLRRLLLLRTLLLSSDSVVHWCSSSQLGQQAVQHIVQR